MCKSVCTELHFVPRKLAPDGPPEIVAEAVQTELMSSDATSGPEINAMVSESQNLSWKQPLLVFGMYLL